MKKIILFAFLLIGVLYNSSALASTSGVLFSNTYEYEQLSEKMNAPFNVAQSEENISTLTGEMTITATDLVLPGKNGHNVEIKRDYGNAKTDDTIGGIGVGNYAYAFKSYVYQDSSNNQYSVLFYSEDDMLANAEDDFYAESGFVVSGTTHYEYNNIRKKNSAGIKLTRRKDISGSNYTKQYTNETYYFTDRAYGLMNKIACNWNFVRPYIKITLTGTQVYSGIRDIESNGFIVDFDGNIEVVDQIYRERDGVCLYNRFAIGGGLLTGTYVSENDIFDNGIYYNRTVKDNKGRTMYFNKIGNIVACDDRYGNRILYDGNTIIDTMGRVITLSSSGITYTEPGSNEVRQITYTTDTVIINNNDPYLDASSYRILNVTDEKGNVVSYHSKKKKHVFTANDLPSEDMDVYLLEKIVYPNNDSKNYTYERNYISFAMLRGKASKVYKYKVKSKFDLVNSVKSNEYTYSYDHPDEGTPPGIYASTARGNITRISDGMVISETHHRPNYTYSDKEFSKKNTQITYQNPTAYKTTNYEYRETYHGKKYVYRLLENDNGFTTERKFEYDNQLMLLRETEIINGSPQIQKDYTYNADHNVMTSLTYKKDNNTTIRVENTLTNGNKAVAVSKIYENNVFKNQTSYTYNSYGEVIATALWDDPNNNNIFESNETTQVQTGYTYNQDKSMTISNYVDGVKDADNANSHRIEAVYDLNYYGELVSVTDPNGNETSMEYDKKGRVIRQTNPDLTTVEAEYNEEEMYSVYTNENGEEIKQKYNFYGQPTEKYVYSDNNWIKLEANYYNNVNQLEKIRAYKNASEYVETAYQYQSDGRMSRVEVRNNQNSLIGRTDYTYQFSKYQYIVIATTQGDGSITPVTKKEYFDQRGNLTKQELVDGNNISTTTYTYDLMKNLLTVKDPMNRVTTSTYDYAGNVLTVTNAANQTMTSTYDKRGRPVSSTDFKGNTTTTKYDPLDRLLSITSPLNQTESAKIKYYYDNNSNVVMEKVLSKIQGGAEIWNQKENTYNSRNMLITAAVGDGLELSYAEYEYTPTGQIERLKIGADIPQITEYTYNELGQLISVTDPLLQLETYEYDWFGNVLRKTDKNGVETVTTYNGHQKPLTISAGSDIVSYTYDILGNIKTAQNNTGTTSYAYDNFGRLTTETLPNNVVNSYTYDKNNNRLSYDMKKSNVTQISANYVYNNKNLLTNVTNNGIITAYTYDNNGNLLTETTGQKVSEFTYDNGNRMISTVNKYAGNTLESEAYVYYPDGNKASKTDLNGDIVSYVYDSVGRLITEDDNGDLTQYFYDEYSNRSQKTSQNSVTDYVYDLNNRLNNEITETDAETITNSYFYDNNGNLYSKMMSVISESDDEFDIGVGITDDYSAMYTYNNFNQLMGVTKGSESFSYTYNPNGLRASKTVGGVTTNHIWDGQNMVGEYGSSGTISAKYLRGIRLTARQVGSTVDYYNFNGHGDTTSLMDSNGTITVSYSFDAFGNQATPTQNDTNPFRYAGEYTDAETGMIYLRARYYDPSLGRFISEDPYWNVDNMTYGDNPNEDNPVPDIAAIMQSSNLYVYGMNNPVRWIDPSGKVVTDWDRANLHQKNIDRLQYYTDHWDEQTDDMKWRWARDADKIRAGARNDKYEYTENGITKSKVTGNEIHFVTSSTQIGAGTLSVSVGYSYYDDGSKYLVEGWTKAFYSSEGMSENTAGFPKSYLISNDPRGKKSIIRVTVPFSSKAAAIGGTTMLDAGIFAITEYTSNTGGGVLTLDFHGV